MTTASSQRYIDVLQELVRVYNTRVHRTTKFRPIDVTETSVKLVFENTMKFHNTHKIPSMNIYTQKFHVGDSVRVARLKTVFEHGYTANWSHDIFRISKVIRKQPFFVYKLEHQNGTPVKETFYAEQLQHINMA